METQTDFLTEEITESQIRRKILLPWWIKVFMWIFLVIGIIVPVALIVAIAGFSFEISLYGLESNQPLSLIGLLLSIIYILKGFVAFGFLKETDWAVNIGIIDAILGIAICAFVMFVKPIINSNEGFVLDFRLELLILIPYLIKLNKIRADWNTGY